MEVLVQQPAHVSSRDGKYLLIWDSPTQWMLADKELVELVRGLDGTRTLEEVLSKLAEHNGRELVELEKDAQAVLKELDDRGLLNSKKTKIEPEEVSLANVTYNITNRCNLKCAWCYNSDRKTPEAPVESVMDALENSRHVFADDISFNILGGEPTLDPYRLVTCMARAQQMFTGPTLISTNGTLVDESLARVFSKHKVEIQVSIDAPDAAKHDAIRGDGVYDKAMNAIKLLKAQGVTVILSMVFDRDSYVEFEEFLDLALEVGADEARFIPLRLIGRAEGLSERKPDLIEAYHEFHGILLMRPEFHHLIKRDFFSIMKNVCSVPGHKTGCGLGRKVLFIDADGGIYPCPNLTMPEYYCGTVADTSIADAINCPVFRRLQDVCRTDKRESCSKCIYRHWCAGDCRAEAMFNGGDFYARAVHCHEFPELIEQILWDSK